jgi:hypothetical protein
MKHITDQAQREARLKQLRALEDGFHTAINAIETAIVEVYAPGSGGSKPETRITQAFRVNGELRLELHRIEDEIAEQGGYS